MILRMQLALFTQDLLRNPEFLADDFVNNCELFEGCTATKNNLPESVPSDIPICNITTKDNLFYLSIARGRIDLHSIKIDEDMKLITLFYENAKKITSFIYEQKKINRVGVITTTFEEHENYQTTMEQYFTKKSYVKGASEISFRYNQIDEYKNTKINNIYSVDTVPSIPIGDKNFSGIVCTYDKNTVHDERKILSIEFLRGFIDACRKEKVKRY